VNSTQISDRTRFADYYSRLLLETYHRLRNDAATRLSIALHELPEHAG